ncbi:MAG TPA: glycosyltransferase family 39 protein [Anaerolineae bacterium]|nr:glycosyltransferase family 39 protein [Anaerolineae bacterium]
MRDSRLASRLEKLLLAAALLAGVLVRVYLVSGPLDPISSDEAVPGLMAQHIRFGARPLFDYSLAYHGPLESYLTAPLFALLGMERLSLHLAPLVLSLAFIGAVYVLGRQLYGRGVGLFSAMYAALPAPMLTIWGLKFGAGYIVVLVLGTLGLALTIGVLRHASAGKAALLIALLGLSFWVHYVTIYYVLAIWLTWGVHRFRARSGAFPRRPASLGARLAVAALSIIALISLCGVLSALGLTPTDFTRTTIDFFVIALPVLLGFVQPSAAPALFAGQIAELGGVYVLGVGVAIGVGALVVWMGMRQLSKGDRLLPLYVASAIIVFGLLFTLGRSPTALLHEPRYLLPLYSAIPLVGLALFELTRKSMVLRVVLLGGLIAFNLYGNLTLAPALNLPYISGQTLANNDSLVEWLDDRGIRHIYADFWIGYWIAFDSQERVVPYIITADLRPGWNRYPPYAKEVDRAENPAYVFVAGSDEAEAFAGYLSTNMIEHDTSQIDIFRVFWNLSRPVRFPLGS